MNYWEAVLVTFRPIVWVLICMGPLVLMIYVDDVTGFHPNRLLSAILLQGIICLSLYLRFIQ